ncbi:MAG: ABC transporter ATP-binding protein/permease [Gammaproteobacteria bacterium]|nr:ABC transporter ATP-binding protein/permease [Gammaproteobacteria bacterium]
MVHRQTSKPHSDRKDWQNLNRLFPFVWDYRGRVVIALVCLVLSKLAVVGMPLVLKEIIDGLDSENGVLVLPIVLLMAYGVLRLASSLFNELRDAVFARVRYHAMRGISQRVLNHLYSLSLRYHLDRKTGGIIRDLERGTNSLSSVLNYLVFNIIPTAAEFALVAVILLGKYEAKFAFVTFITVVVYIGFTLSVTEWRMHYRLRMNALESEANTYAVDGIINYETVKYFNNEDYELSRYEATLKDWEHAAVKSQNSMSILNFGQGAVIAVGVTFMMVYAAQGVVSGSMSLGDLVLVNAMMLQLFLPLNFLGVIYRALKYALADMDMMMRLLETKEEIVDKSGATPLRIDQAHVHVEHLSFSYNQDRKILDDISFEIPPGHKVAVVGPSGAGKSTLARLLFRFYEADDGRVLIDGQNICDVTQESLRQNIGIVPQDTVLFNQSIYHNIHYANRQATMDDVIHAARVANIDEFIQSLPDGYETIVGERGLKLSGGEKQRIAIARVILKNPRILVFDEATSSLDSRSEQSILASLKQVAMRHTTLVIAHRLSTIIDADNILVMDRGRIVEHGSHQALLARDGLYAHLWQLQQDKREHELALETVADTV